jgi:hypothetical protein
MACRRKGLLLSLLVLAVTTVSISGEDDPGIIARPAPSATPSKAPPKISEEGAAQRNQDIHQREFGGQAKRRGVLTAAFVHAFRPSVTWNSCRGRVHPSRSCLRAHVQGTQHGEIMAGDTYEGHPDEGGCMDPRGHGGNNPPPINSAIGGSLLNAF